MRGPLPLKVSLGSTFSARWYKAQRQTPPVARTARDTAIQAAHARLEKPVPLVGKVGLRGQSFSADAAIVVLH